MSNESVVYPLDYTVDGPKQSKIPVRVNRWSPDLVFPDPASVRYLSIDTETEKIVKGAPIVPVIMQVLYGTADFLNPDIPKRVDIVFAQDIPIYVKLLEQTYRNTEYVFHSAYFDLDVLNLKENPWLVDKLEKGQITDVAIRYMLKTLDEGDNLTEYNLAYIAKDLIEMEVSKTDDERLFFKRDEEPSELQIRYAATDVVVTSLIRETLAKKYPTEDLQVRGHVALGSMSTNGLLVDLTYLKDLQDKFTAQCISYLETLSIFGWRPREKGNEAVLQNILANIELRTGLTFERTATKSISTEDSSLVATFLDAGLRPHPFIDAYKSYKHLEKIMSTYLNNELIGVDGRMHPMVRILVRTGRTALSRPNLQNLPRMEGIRGMYVAPPGYCLVSVDYNQLELCALAEHCWLKYGISKMRELINAGVDVHSWFGKEIAGAEGEDPELLSKDKLKFFRQIAKITDFGYPGGLSPTTFVGHAAGYGVELTKEAAAKLKTLWINSFPEMQKHLSPQEDIDRTNRRARHGLYDILKNPGKYPILQEKITSELKTRAFRLQTLSQIVNFLDNELHFPREELYKFRRDAQVYIADTVSGRVKRNCTYCAACNYPFQGLSSDGAKCALWLIWKAGFKIVNFIHDEVIVELKCDENLDANVRQIMDLMIDGMQQIIKHVKIKVEPAVMDRWYKEAGAVYDEEDGAIKMWTPPENCEV